MKRLLLLLGLAGIVALADLLLSPAATAAGGTYEVIQCSALNRGDEAEVTRRRAYHLVRRCDVEADDNAMKIENISGAAKDALGAFAWTAPEQTGFVRVVVAGKLRRDSGHRAELLMADRQGRETFRVAAGGTESPSGFSNETWKGPSQGKFIAQLVCGRSGGCDHSDRAKTWVRNLRFTLVDHADPEVGASGSLLSGGWLRGHQAIQGVSSDRGSGVQRGWLSVNGTPIYDRRPDCSIAPAGLAATSLSPCPTGVDLLRIEPNTSTEPFQDGLNDFEACAKDFGGNTSCEHGTLKVDNAAPWMRFAGSQLSDDPELIRAPVSDEHSGVAFGQLFFRAVGDEIWQPLSTQRTEGELRARVDTAAYPPGLYEFRAEAEDVAGNRTQTTLKEDETPMVLSFPLRSGVDLHARIEPGGQERLKVSYGRSVVAKGRLLSREGTPLVGQEIRVEEYFGEGALIDRRVRLVETDERGRWESGIPAGPSRSVRAYYDGDARYLADSTPAGSLAVLTKARFRPSTNRVQEGRSVVFGGRIGRLGARIPAGGKLLELQVLERPGRWNTVREAFRTGPGGRYRLRYRFGTFYQRNVRFTFRVKVAREADWPYHPASSGSRSVTVLAR